MNTARINPAVLALVLTVMSTGCGGGEALDDIAAAVDATTVDAGDDETALSGLFIDAVDVEVSPCLCRCVTDTTTRITLRGRGFVPEAVVKVDGVDTPTVFTAEGTLWALLWESPEAGDHRVAVHIDRDGVVADSNAVSFVMPDAAPAP